jgi:hypothetical protein
MFTNSGLSGNTLAFKTAKLRSIRHDLLPLLYLAVSLDFFRSLDLCSEG